MDCERCGAKIEPKEGVRLEAVEHGSGTVWQHCTICQRCASALGAWLRRDLDRVLRRVRVNPNHIGQLEDRQEQDNA